MLYIATPSKGAANIFTFLAVTPTKSPKKGGDSVAQQSTASRMDIDLTSDTECLAGTPAPSNTITPTEFTPIINNLPVTTESHTPPLAAPTQHQLESNTVAECIPHQPAPEDIMIVDAPATSSTATTTTTTPSPPSESVNPVSSAMAPIQNTVISLQVGC